jgi:TolB protein
MDEREPFDDPGPPVAERPSRVRRSLTVAVLLVLVASIVVLAFISGRGIVSIAPNVAPTASAGTVSSAPTSAPTAVATVSRLAIVDAAGRLTTTDATGGALAVLGEPGVVYSYPAWSPDGSRIAVIGQSITGAPRLDVFTIGPDGAATGAPVTVYSSLDQPPFYLYWAPDSRHVTFLTTQPDGLALRLVPSDGSSPATPIRAGSPMYWAWAGDGRLLVHSGGSAAGAFFGETGADGVSAEPDAVEPGDFRAPAVSRDGRFRAYVGPGDGTAAQVVVEGRDRSNRHTLDVFGGAAIDFGPSSDELAFIAPAEAGRAVTLPVGPLRLIDAGSGDVRTVLDGSDVAFYWSPDGQTIAALQIAVPGDDKVAATGIVLAGTGGLPRPAVAPAAPASGLALRLVFVDVASGTIRSQRAVQVGDTYALQQLPYFDQYALSHRAWSADSRLFALPLTDPDGTSRIVVIAPDGSSAVPIGTGVAAAWSP